ncbi:hypothetical protein ACSBR2_023422 [Camellia fascicularis]
MVGHYGLIPLLIDRGADFDPIRFFDAHWLTDTTSHGMVRYSWFYDHFSKSQPATTDEVAQYTSSFLMYLLGTTLFANRENTVGLYLLEALVHLPQVTEYDWGGAGLATLYCYMSSVSHYKTDSLGGY